MKMAFYWTLSQTCFWIGHIFSLPMSWGWMDKENKVTEFLGYWDYKIYNYFMLKSLDFDKGNWTWEPPEDGTH